MIVLLFSKFNSKTKVLGIKIREYSLNSNSKKKKKRQEEIKSKSNTNVIKLNYRLRLYVGRYYNNYMFNCFGRMEYDTNLF